MNHPNLFKSHVAVIALCIGCVVLFAPPVSNAQSSDGAQFRRLPIATYRQKMKAGWLGQMIGVAFTSPTEFRYLSTIMPEEDVPKLHPGLINESFTEDNLYVEMTFLKTLETYGMDASSAQAGIDFANSQYQLWHANLAARKNLRAGIAPPDSGHPAFNGFTDDIDYQIEADFAGLISPGMPDQSIRLGETFGRIMNYGDGLYGGQFVSCMYSEAFFEDNPRELVEAGLACIPAASQYAETVRDVLQWSAEYPDDWEKTWALIDEKYQKNPDYRRFSSKDDYITDPEFNIDAKLNGAYIVLGLLYGERDPLKTMTISMRSGQDSDCNPSNAVGILFAMLGYDQTSSEFTAGLDEKQKFSYTEYDFPSLIAVSEKLAREAILKAGGAIEMDANGDEVFVIPVKAVQSSEFLQSWEPGPTANLAFNPDQMAKIQFPSGSLELDVQRFAPNWSTVGCLDNPHLGLKTEILGRRNILFTLPASRTVSCRLTRQIQLPVDVHKTLHLEVANFPDGEWMLVVKVNNEPLLEQIVSDKTTTDGWLTVDVDLSAYAGQTTRLELLNKAHGRSSWQGAYWAVVELIDKPS